MASNSLTAPVPRRKARRWATERSVIRAAKRDLATLYAQRGTTGQLRLAVEMLEALRGQR